LTFQTAATQQFGCYSAACNVLYTKLLCNSDILQCWRKKKIISLIRLAGWLASLRFSAAINLEYHTLSHKCVTFSAIVCQYDDITGPHEASVSLLQWFNAISRIVNIPAVGSIVYSSVFGFQFITILLHLTFNPYTANVENKASS
jgi:hypothetical protein